MLDGQYGLYPIWILMTCNYTLEFIFPKSKSSFSKDVGMIYYSPTVHYAVRVKVLNFHFLTCGLGLEVANCKVIAEKNDGR